MWASNAPHNRSRSQILQISHQGAAQTAANLHQNTTVRCPPAGSDEVI
jgi:hypothetical protein